jgi:hypothetical protein
MPCPSRETPAGIEPTTLYPRDALCRRLGWSLSAYQSARARGLPVLYLGKRVFIFGADAIDWIRKTSTANKPRKGQYGNRHQIETP